MNKIIECVPNFSEGRDQSVIDSLADAVRSVPGVRLLDVDPGASTNRTVVTFVGNPENIIEGALAAARVAFQKIDMTKHKGEHPRMGALDVCPFVPVRGVTVEECVEVSIKFGERLAQELDVPVFLYGAASQKDYRKTMPQIRAGEYEGMKEKLKDPDWEPDFGPAEFRPKWGATVTGVRKFLIAYNINILSTKEQAHRIALNLREQGRSAEKPGRLKAVQGIGWYLEEQNIAQISLNLTDFHVTPIHVAYEEAKKDAEELYLGVTGSEIVGLVPLESILMAAEYYIKKENLFIIDELQKVHLVINRLGLSTLSPFNPKERIIEYCFEDDIGPLAGTSVAEFIRKVGGRTAAPGGGSVSALVASLGSALMAMVCQLSYGKRQWEHLDAQMRKVIPPLHQLYENLIPIIDEDTEAFKEVMDSLKLPKNTKEEIVAQEKASVEAIRKSIAVPLKILKRVSTIWPFVHEAAEVGNINCKSDLEVGARCLDTGVYGAYRNVCINLENFPDESEKQKLFEEAKNLLEENEIGYQKTVEIIKNRK
ncbi:UNVERIFIED_CONTAM: hypothetical protein RMT77_003014 [Armadillidium vulgare]